METVKLGLKENRNQFILLVLVNAFVGGMVGIERTILTKVASVEFHLAAKTAILSFIAVFGLVKALTNYFAGALANTTGRKKLLVAGWIAGLPVPAHLRAFLGLGDRGQCAFGHQPGPCLEQHRGDEDRPGGGKAAGTRHGAE